MLLENKIAIVSGIGPGMGRDVSLAFAREGADLVISARTASKLDSVADEIEALGRKVLKVPTDISDPAACRALAEQAVARFGRIDILVNSAFHPGTYNLFLDDDLENWRAPVDTNLFGTLYLTKAVVPTMVDQGKGSVVMINSMVIRDVLPTMLSYAASKAALLAATQGLARELGTHGVRVNSVCPGYIWGPSLEAYFAHQAKERGVDAKVVYDEVASQTALGWLPHSSEIADSVVFFASDLSRVVTGQSLDVNCGQVMV